MAYTSVGYADIIISRAVDYGVRVKYGHIPIGSLFYDAFYHKGGMTQKEICQRTFQSKQTVNLIIKNLLAENYVTVTEVPENKRNKIVQMTDAGRAY